jgi:hypothetical protein
MHPLLHIHTHSLYIYLYSVATCWCLSLGYRFKKSPFCNISMGTQPWLIFHRLILDNFFANHLWLQKNVLRLYSILEVVFFAREPLTPQALSDLLNMDRNELDGYLSSLCPVLQLPDVSNPDGVVRALHQSFLDFVRQRGSPIHSEMIIDATVAEEHLAECCMFQLNKLLHLNMCRLPNPSLFNDDISDLEMRMRQYATATLRYSCRFWIMHWLKHIRAAGARAQVPDGLGIFCAEHLLHWIEFLSLTKGLPAVDRAMSNRTLEIVVRCLILSFVVSVLNGFHQSHPDWKGMEFVQLLDDARSLMRDYHTSISLSALQVYYSGVVNMP